jgi:pimeloyl-ACP methyl ester carboxylesterase
MKKEKYISRYFSLAAFFILGLCVNTFGAQPIQPESAVKYKTVKIDGLDIFYREAGDPTKPNLLLLHGFPTSSFMFRDLIPQLADSYHVVAPDYPGFGQSSMPTTTEFDYTFENLTSVVDKFTQAVGLIKYSIYVQDYGSPIGFRLAVKHPERIQSLIIQNGNAYEFGLSENATFLKTYGETHDPKTTETILNFLTLEGTRFQYVTGAHDPGLISPDTWNHDQPLLDRPGNKEIQLALFADYSSNVKSYPRWHEYFRKNQPPTLVVWGKNDPFFTVRGVEEGYKKDLKNIEIHYYDGGHFALEEYGPEIAQAIRDFLRKKLR